MIWKVSSGDFKDIIDGLFLIKISVLILENWSLEATLRISQMLNGESYFDLTRTLLSP